jgi:hypothetical protein
MYITDYYNLSMLHWTDRYNGFHGIVSKIRNSQYLNVLKARVSDHSGVIYLPLTINFSVNLMFRIMYQVNHPRIPPVTNAFTMNAQGTSRSIRQRRQDPTCVHAHARRSNAGVGGYWHSDVQMNYSKLLLRTTIQTASRTLRAHTDPGRLLHGRTEIERVSTAAACVRTLQTPC